MKYLLKMLLKESLGEWIFGSLLYFWEQLLDPLVGQYSNFYLEELPYNRPLFLYPISLFTS